MFFEILIIFFVVLSKKTSSEIETGMFIVDDEIGDIALNVECLEKESKEQGKELRNHFLHLLAHGILHLLGETHHKIDDERKMEALEIDFLKRLNITNPYKI